MARLGERAGLPPGAWNVVTSEPARVGAVLTASPTVRALSFTGSTATGRLLMAQCAPTVKRLALELGGNAPFIVFDDADLERAIEGALVSKYRNTGRPGVANRFLVQDGIYDAFATLLAERVRALPVGDGREPGVQQGPLISAAALAKVEAHVADALGQGAKLLCGGRRHARGGNFYEPTVLAEATPAMRCAREETFGPVAPLFRFRDEAEAIRLANDTEFGLAAYLYTRDLGRAWRVAEALEVGMLGINEGLISTESRPSAASSSPASAARVDAGLDEYVGPVRADGRVASEAAVPSKAVHGPPSRAGARRRVGAVHAAGGRARARRRGAGGARSRTLRHAKPSRSPRAARKARSWVDVHGVAENPRSGGSQARTRRRCRSSRAG
jgi:succinate-semialdehyde dehydrogenase/glutarate-semialdehyde dehydrogenase